MDESEEVDGAAIVSCGDAAEVFEFVEASFDAITRFVDVAVVGNETSSRWVVGDDGSSADIGDDGAQGIAVIGFVGDHVVRLEAGQERLRLRNIAALSGRQDDPQTPSLGIGGEMDLGG